MINSELSEKASESYKYEKSPTLESMNVGFPNKSWTKINACPACSFNVVKDFAVIRNIHYSLCSECGFKFANPYPSDEFLSNFYNSSFYNNYRKFEESKIQEKPYFSVSFGDLPRLASWIKEDKAAKILDFGCGPGSFAALLRDKFGYINVEGYELNSASREVARRCYGMDLISDISSVRPASYDLITLIEVLEHVPNPKDFLKYVGSFIKPGGRIFITTDSVDNLVSRYAPSYSVHYTGPSHISMFTRKSIADILLSCKFTIERFEVDKSTQIFDNFVAAPFYKVDFVSPMHDDDHNDILFTPTKLGRFFGLQPRRSLPIPFRVLRKADRMMARLFNVAFGYPFSEHLYVIARKAKS